MRFLRMFLVAMFVFCAACDEDSSQPEEVSDSHPGWKMVNCQSCHNPDGHQEGLTPGECSDCHGTNGAPAGHSGDTPCLDCHGAAAPKSMNPDHLAADLVDPADCQACHGG